MAKYQIQTSGGTYEIETDEGAPAAPSVPPAAPQSGLESFGRAAVNNLPLGGQIGAAGTAFANSEDYQKALADWNAKAAAGKAQNPKSYGAGAVAGTVAPLAIPGVGEMGLAGDAALGAAYGAGNTDLTNIPEAAKDAAIGGVTGGALGAVGKAASGALDTVGQYAGRFGENQAIKALGGSGGQIRDLGIPESRALARRATENYGLLDADMGPIGREETVQAMKQQAGHDIGDIREAAGAAPHPSDVEAQIRANLGDKYTSGVYKGEAGGFEKALEDIRNLQNPTFADYAQKASDLNHYAAGNKLTQATNAETDVANQLSHLNDKGITDTLPDMADQYADTKGTFQDMKNLEPMIERGESRSMASRGANTLFEQGKKFTEEIGAHKVAARMGMAAGDTLQGASDSGAINKGAMATTNGVVSTIMSKIQTAPQSLGKYAAPLMQAAQGGPQGIAATHYVLSLQHPEYNKMWQDQSQGSSEQ